MLFVVLCPGTPKGGEIVGSKMNPHLNDLKIYI